MQRRSSKATSLLKVGNLYQASTTLGLEPVSIIHYTWPESSIKRPTPNSLAPQRHVNWPVIYLESSYKIMDLVSAALPQYLRCNSGMYMQLFDILTSQFISFCSSSSHSSSTFFPFFFPSEAISFTRD